MNKIYKIIIPILIITMTFLINPTKEYAAQNNIKIGDINNDGVIDSRDTLRMLEHIAASTIKKIGQKHPDWILKDDKLKAGDINSDGVIDSRDTLRELEYIAASTIKKIEQKHPEWKTNIEKKWKVEATEIKLDKTDMTIYKSKVGKINATIVPTNATDKTVKWSSSNTQVATVDGLGNVEGKNNGIAIITATTSNGKKATCKVTVNNLSVAVTSISLNKTALTMTRGNSTTIIANVMPTNATDKTVKWSSSNNNIVTVSNGRITAKKAGTGIITATTSNGKKAICKVTVNPIVVSSIKLKQIDCTIAVGTSLQLNAIITPTNADNKTITWSSSDSKIAQVTKTGVVKGLKVGKITITAKTANNKTAKCIIRVNIPAKSISLNKTNTTISKGNTLKLTVTFNPTNTSSKIITWKSSNTNVATVNNKGEVKAINKGTAVITATSKYGKTATCTISVVENQKLLDSLRYAYKFTVQAGGHITYAGHSDPRRDGKLEKGYSDCSHFVHRVFEHTGVMKKFVRSYYWGYNGCPNTTDVAHFKKGEKWDYSKASPGDVIWEHYGSGTSNHVYIYIGDGKIIECSAGHSAGKAVDVRKARRVDSSTKKYERKIIHFNEFPYAPNSYFDTKTQTIKYK